MAKTNEPNGFAYRVNFAASVISAKRTPTRNFDNCFENHDGDAVGVALYRRARNNPKLRANLWRYISRNIVVPAAYQQRHCRDLKAWSAQLRANAKARNEAFYAELEAQRA